MELPNRKPLRLKDYDYSQNGAYFVTICTANKKKIFWENVGADIIRPENVPLSVAGKIVKQGIRQIAEHYEGVAIDKYCIMPNHIHLILRAESNMNGRMVSAPTISSVIGSMKRWISKQIGSPIWQKSFYDHVIRGDKDYLEIWEYIDTNPAKWKADKLYAE